MGVGVTCVAPAARFVACRYEDRVGVWRINEGRTIGSMEGNEMDDWEGMDGTDPSDGTGWSKMLEMQLKVETSLSAIALSSNGSYLAVADLTEVKLFLLNQVRKFLQFLDLFFVGL